MEITLKDLNSGYNKNIVIKDLNISFEKEKFHFITGVSGSGKSTLLETISLLIKRISGEILFNGKSADDKENLNIFRNSSGIMLQYAEKQFFNTTVKEEIIFNLKRKKLSKREIEKKLDETVEKLKIEKKLLDVSPFELSGGEKRIAALASVIISSPKILFLDEPTAGLDFENKKIFMSSLKYLNKNNGITIIQSSHILEDIIEYGDSVLILSKEADNINSIKGDAGKLLFSKDILNKYGLKEPELFKYIETFKDFGLKDTENIKNKKDLVYKLFNNK